MRVRLKRFVRLPFGVEVASPVAGILLCYVSLSYGMDSGSERARRSRLRHPVLLVITCLLAPVLWVAFVATFNPHELLVGVAVCAATVLFSVIVGRSSEVQVELRPRDLAQAWRIPWYIVSGVTEITLVLFKDLLGIARAKSLFRVCGFDSSTHDPVRIARTVLAVAYTTSAPNFIVVGIDPAQSRMLFHQIEASPVQKMGKALGAKG